MIAWSILAAQKSQVFDQIIVSTDDEEIAAIAKSLGATVPFLRPASLSDDYTGTTEVIAHAIQWAQDQGFTPDTVCCIYATAPFIQAADIQASLKTLQEGSWSYVFTATDFAAPIFRSFQQNAQGGIEMFYPEHFNTRSQDLPTALHDAAQFYWGQAEAWLNHKPAFDKHSYPFILPRWRVQDIDTEDDWHRAEAMAPALLKIN